MGKLDKLIARVKRTNAEYKTLTRAEKRVMIARDVIAALRAKALDAKEGSYVYIDTTRTTERYWGGTYETNVYNKFLKDSDQSESFQKLLPSLPDCKVCAKGAIFVCAVARQNKVETAKADDVREFEGEALSENLRGIFSARQLDLIEAEFEREDMQFTLGPGWEPVMKEREDPTERMIAIMKNIIRNKGTFAPREGE